MGIPRPLGSYPHPPPQFSAALKVTWQLPHSQWLFSCQCSWLVHYQVGWSKRKSLLIQMLLLFILFVLICQHEALSSMLTSLTTLLMSAHWWFALPPMPQACAHEQKSMQVHMSKKGCNACMKQSHSRMSHHSRMSKCCSVILQMNFGSWMGDLQYIAVYCNIYQELQYRLQSIEEGAICNILHNMQYLALTLYCSQRLHGNNVTISQKHDQPPKIITGSFSIDIITNFCPTSSPVIKPEDSHMSTIGTISIIPHSSDS